MRRPPIDLAFGGRGRQRGRTGLFGPFPYYTRRTRGGSSFAVSGCGCCLPLALALSASPFVAGRTLWRIARR